MTAQLWADADCVCRRDLWAFVSARTRKAWQMNGRGQGRFDIVAKRQVEALEL